MRTTNNCPSLRWATFKKAWDGPQQVCIHHCHIAQLHARMPSSNERRVKLGSALELDNIVNNHMLHEVGRRALCFIHHLLHGMRSNVIFVGQASGITPTA